MRINLLKTRYSLLEIYLRDPSSNVTDSCSTTFVAALFITEKFEMSYMFLNRIMNKKYGTLYIGMLISCLKNDMKKM